MVATLSVSPAVALIDVPRRIVVKGLKPQEPVTLSSRTVRGEGAVWQAAAHFVADADGTVDLARDAPVDGSYQGVSPMGLLWAQAPEAGADPRAIFAAAAAADLHTVIGLQRADGSALQTDLVQQLAASGVTRREIREDGLVGTLFQPAADSSKAPPAAILVLNGSGGGINEPRAALYASHGYA
ncbi:MAG: acyl-CoA thioesterase/BAAT N-terminal domain-containing protein, partial [Pseudomonadota bacterium]|nr:acyl-CoA thioesterase/BAAT N-terminal domain-containing protein [Pseudomonadota bacterium]